MTIGLRLRFAGGTEEQYEAVQQELGARDDAPEGLIFHAGGPVDDGWGVIDFWESREAFDRFVEERLAPARERAGDRALPGPPDVREFPVHEVIKP